MKFRYRKGERVDFDDDNGGQLTPGTIVNRVHTLGHPRYVVKWDDGDESNEHYAESDLIPYDDPHYI